MAGGVVPIVAIVAAVGAILGSAVLLTSKNDEAPKYHSAFAYAGFFVGVVWIYVISMEIVVLLQVSSFSFRSLGNGACQASPRGVLAASKNWSLCFRLEKSDKWHGVAGRDPGGATASMVKVAEARSVAGRSPS